MSMLNGSAQWTNSRNIHTCSSLHTQMPHSCIEHLICHIMCTSSDVARAVRQVYTSHLAWGGERGRTSQISCLLTVLYNILYQQWKGCRSDYNLEGDNVSML